MLTIIGIVVWAGAVVYSLAMLFSFTIGGFFGGAAGLTACVVWAIGYFIYQHTKMKRAMIDRLHKGNTNRGSTI